MTDLHGGGGDIAQEAARVRGFKHELEAQVPPLAVSLDGLAFTFAAPVSMVLPVGGYVTVQTAAGPALGQLRDVALEHTPGPEIPVASGTLAGLRTRMRFDRIVGTGAMLQPGLPFHDVPFACAEAADVAEWLVGNRPRGANLRVGQATLAPGVESRLDATGFGRHTFLCGQSGSGKSYAMGLLLEQLLLETDLPIVVLDPNSDATRLAELLPGADPRTAERWAAIAPQIAVRRAGGTGDERLRLRFFDLDPELQQAAIGLDPLADREEYDQLRGILEAEATGLSFEGLQTLLAGEPSLRPLALRIRNLGLLEWSIWARESGAGGLLDDLDHGEQRCLVVDLGSLPTAGERSLVSAAVLSQVWRRRADRRPVLVVIDEAHNVCPPDPTDALTAIATERGIQIAGEGRKFGLHLVVATQRPLKVHENVLSQCDNLILMRMNSAGDLARLAELFSFVPPALLGRATSFGLGQALVAGRIAPHPMLVTTGGRIAQEGGADVPATWARG